MSKAVAHPTAAGEKVDYLYEPWFGQGLAVGGSPRTDCTRSIIESWGLGPARRRPLVVATLVTIQTY